MIVDLKQYKSVICLDGDLPSDLVRQMSSLRIIATDGAADKLVRNKIDPDLIIGDLDSASPDVLKHFEHIKVEDQDFTDFEKALSHVKEQNLQPSIITGVNGGYLDRILMNISVLLQTNSIFVSENMVGLVISGHSEIACPISSKISIFGFNNAEVTTSGLKWNLDHATLNFGDYASCSNVAVSEKISLDISTLAIMFIYGKVELN